MTYTVISSESFGFVFPTSFGSTFTMGIFCTQDFVSDDGKIYMNSAGDSLSANFVAKVTGTVTGGVGTFASYSLPKTDAGTNPSTRYFARIFTSTGSPTDYYPFTNRHLRTSLGDSITELMWANDNRAPISPQPDGAPSTSQMNLAIAAAINSPATTTRLGIGEIDTTPVDSARPVFVGSNSPTIFGSISRIIIANNMPGADVGAKINAADLALGPDTGEIIYLGGGTISTRISLSPNRICYLRAGTYINATSDVAILMDSNTTLHGDGNQTIIVENTAPLTPGGLELGVIFQKATYSSNGATAQNITIGDLQILGANAGFGSSVPTIHLGNTHHARVDNVFLNGTHSIGINAGAASTIGSDPLGLGRYAEDVIVSRCSFERVASQNLTLVNGKNIIFRSCIFKDPSLLGGPGVTVIDCEANDFTNDYMEDVIIEGHVIDSRNSAISPHGNLIAFQPPSVHTGGFRIAGNIGTAGNHASNGVFLGSNSRDGEIVDNQWSGLGQTGMTLRGTRLTVADNFLTNTGQGGNHSLYLLDLTDSSISDNYLKSSVSGLDDIREDGTSTNNKYKGNDVSGLSLNAGSFNLGNIVAGKFQSDNLSLLGSTSGSTTVQANATAGTTTLTLPAATDTLVGKATTDTLTNKTLTAPVVNSPTGIVKGDVGLGNVANVDTSNASNISSGTLPAARLTAIGVRAYSSTNLSINDSTDTALAFNAERFDSDSMHSTSVNTSRITFNTAGVYTVTTTIAFASNSTGYRIVAIRINGGNDIARQAIPAVNGTVTSLTAGTTYKFSPADYVEVWVYQTSGGALNVSSAGNYSPEFSAVYSGQ